MVYNSWSRVAVVYDSYSTSNDADLYIYKRSKADHLQDNFSPGEDKLPMREKESLAIGFP